MQDNLKNLVNSFSDILNTALDKSERKSKTHFEQINSWAKERGLLDIEWDKTAHASFLAEELSEFLRSKDEGGEIDALCDIIVFATNAIRIRGYDPNVAMDETLKEISSRTGAFNPETGKWEKFKTPEAMALWYSANYDKAKV